MECHFYLKSPVAPRDVTIDALLRLEAGVRDVSTKNLPVATPLEWVLRSGGVMAMSHVDATQPFYLRWNLAHKSYQITVNLPTTRDDWQSLIGFIVRFTNAYKVPQITYEMGSDRPVNLPLERFTRDFPWQSLTLRSLRALRHQTHKAPFFLIPTVGRWHDVAFERADLDWVFAGFDPVQRFSQLLRHRFDSGKGVRLKFEAPTENASVGLFVAQCHKVQLFPVTPYVMRDALTHSKGILDESILTWEVLFQNVFGHDVVRMPYTHFLSHVSEDRYDWVDPNTVRVAPLLADEVVAIAQIDPQQPARSHSPWVLQRERWPEATPRVAFSPKTSSGIFG